MAKTEKKIFLDRKDGVERVIEEIRRAKAVRVVLVVPKGAELGSMVGNFHRLNREAEILGRELVIESVDDHILELASLANVPAVNPVFQKRERAMVDIIPRARRVSEVSRTREESEETREEKKMPQEERRFSKRSRRSGFKKFFVTILVLLLVCGAGWFILFRILPKVTITLELKKVPIDFSYVVVASSKTRQASISGGVLSISGELITSPGNLSMIFPAHGTSTISTKATGKLIVWNAYGKEPQPIVVNTRFESPDHKIFLLNKKVTIPGAKVVNGKLTPSSIEVDVTADQPGDEYNIGPATGWKIPGFAKYEGFYEGFYAESKMAMTGGSSGEKFIATPDDLVSAKQKIEQSLKDEIQKKILVLLEDNFKLLPDAVSYTIINENSVPSDKNDSTFTMFAEGEMKYLVFEESALVKAAAARATTTIEGGVHEEDLQISYGSSTVDFSDGVLRVPVIGFFTLVPDLDQEKLKTEITGDDEEALRSVILGIPGVLKANVKFWPFWVLSAPENTDRVEIIVK